MQCFLFGWTNFQSSSLFPSVTYHLLSKCSQSEESSLFCSPSFTQLKCHRHVINNCWMNIQTHTCTPTVPYATYPAACHSHPCNRSHLAINFFLLQGCHIIQSRLRPSIHLEQLSPCHHSTFQTTTRWLTQKLSHNVYSVQKFAVAPCHSKIRKLFYAVSKASQFKPTHQGSSDSSSTPLLISCPLPQSFLVHLGPSDHSFSDLLHV